MDEHTVTVCVCVCVCVCARARARFCLRLSQNQPAITHKKTGNYFIWQLPYLKVVRQAVMMTISDDSRLHRRYDLRRNTARGVKQKPIYIYIYVCVCVCVCVYTQCVYK